MSSHFSSAELQNENIQRPVIPIRLGPFRAFHFGGYQRGNAVPSLSWKVGIIWDHTQSVYHTRIRWAKANPDVFESVEDGSLVTELLDLTAKGRLWTSLS